MNCQACGAENRPGRRFCGSCGAPLERLCPSCGAANGAEDRFCGECGVALGEAPAAIVAPAAMSPPGVRAGPTPGGVRSEQPAPERRHVTVLFADLVGFTALSDRRDAEEVRDLLSQYFERARTVIGRYGGTVEKFIGDAVMAVWGAPRALEDGAERAVRAALELVDSVAVFGQELGIPGLTARAGVMTGEVAVNVGASGEGMVAGDLVNTASRVQAAAEPGMVYVGDATRQATEAAIVYEDTGKHQLKGKPEPIRLWQAARVVAARGGALRPSGLEPPFVGRDRELRLLKEFLHGTGEEARARLLSIVGMAGVGKSRLAWEFFKYVDGLTETIYWHRGRCLAYGEGVAYSALAEMVRMRAGIAENEATESARDKLHATILDFVAEEEERRWVEPRLAHLVGLEEVSLGDPRDLYAAWRVFFERVAAHSLTVMVFEDLQWADGGLLDFIEYLLDWSRSTPILVITLARPELSERRPGWGTGKRGLASLYLEPLSSEAMTELLDGLVPGLPADVAARIRERAAGIPLYAVETVRMLLDRGLLVESQGKYRLEGSLQALEVPESLHALVAARLDHLSLPERQVLQDASVLGKSFTAAALSAVNGSEESELARLLTGLVSKDLLAIQSDPRSPERGQYVFVQDLVRSVAYATLARRECKLRHLAAAAHLQSAWQEGEDITEVVASHLVAAYRADPDAEDAPEIRDRATRGLIRAGEHANSLSAPASAQRYYEQALELIDDAALRAELHAKAGRAAARKGRGVEARSHLRQAAESFATAGLPMEGAAALTELARLEFREGDSDAAVPRGEKALQGLQGATREEHRGFLGNAESSVASMAFFRGEFTVALEHIERALEIAEELGSWDLLSRSLDTKGGILQTQGRLMEAELLFQGALNVALDHDLPEQAARACSYLATRLEEADRMEDALAVYEQGAELAERIGDRPVMWGNKLNCMAPLFELGRWDACRSIFAGYSEDDVAELSQSTFVAATSLTALWLHLRQGDVLAAHGLLNSSGSTLQKATTGQDRWYFDAAQAAVLNAEGEAGQALALAEDTLRASIEQSSLVSLRQALVEAVEAAFTLDQESKVQELIDLMRRNIRAGAQPSIDAHLLRWTGRLAERRGDAEEAETHLRQAAEAFDSLSRPFWSAVARMELGEVLARAGRLRQAEELIAQARRTFTELGAQPYVDRTDRVLPPARAEGAEGLNPVEASASVPA